MAEQRKTSGDLTEEIATLRADVSRLAETVGRLVEQEVEQAADRFHDTAEELGRRGRAYADRARAEAAAYESQAEEVIVRNPVTSVLVAAGLGFVFGLLSRGR